MKNDLQLEYRAKLGPILDHITQIKSMVEPGSEAYRTFVSRAELKKDRLLFEAKRKLSKNEFTMLRAWVRKELRCFWGF